MSFARRHVQVKYGVLFYHLAVRGLLPNHNATPLYETIGRLNVHHRSALRRTNTGHGRRVHALAVRFAADVLGAGTEQIQENDVHLCRCRAYMYFFHSKPCEYPICLRRTKIDPGHRSSFVIVCRPSLDIHAERTFNEEETAVVGDGQRRRRR